MKTRRTKQRDSLLIEVRQELMPGRFVRYDDMFDFGRHLHQVEEKIAALVENGEAERAVGLYEVFLAAAYDKIEECDDSSANLSMLWQWLFCGWIKARQAAGRPAGETVKQVLRWQENDDYGFCYRIEQDVVKVLDAQAYKLFVKHYESLVDNGRAAIPDPKPTAIFEYENDVRLPALSLKDIYEAKGDTKSFAGLCDRTGVSPGDCERLAKMEMSKKHWKQALAWVEKGLELEPTRNWHNEGSHGLGSKKPEILAKLGRKDESLAMAWADFERHPSNHTYERFMEYVPKVAKAEWHVPAMETAAQANIDDFMDICVATAEWERLASRVLAASDGALEDLSHYTLEPAAEGLAKRDIPAAAKLHRALGFRVLTSKKSKYYDAALSHFRRARDLCRKADLDSEWQAVVDRIYAEHSRKYGFMPRFERLLTNETEPNLSFAENARARWQQQVSDRPDVGGAQ
ncbi:DUF6880 family protein [Verrucomicrobiota bacterium]